jgi:DNA repair protein RecO (recombination protein O)
MSNFLRCRCLILRCYRYSEADLIVRAINQQGLRLSIIAKGAVKSRKRFGGGVLQPTHFVEVVLREPKTVEKMLILEEAVLLRDFGGLRDQFEKLDAALSIVGAIDKLAQEGDTQNSHLFDMTGHFLSTLEKTNRPQFVRIHFLIRLMRQQGILSVNEWMSPFLLTPLNKTEDLDLCLDEVLVRDLESRFNHYLQTAEVRA